MLVVSVALVSTLYATRRLPIDEWATVVVDALWKPTCMSHASNHKPFELPQGVGEVAPATFAQKQVAAGLDVAADDASS